MKSGLFQRNGMQTTFTNNGGVSTNPNLLSIQTSVTRMPMVHGDFKKPNPHSYSITRTTFANGQVQYYTTQGKIANRVVGLIPAFDRSPNLDVNTPLLLAKSKALDRLNERVRGNLDLAPALAEAGKTAKMVGALRNFENWANKAGFTKGSPSFNPKRSLKKLGSNWLEYQFGWKPLLSDIYGAADELIRFTEDGSMRVKAGATVNFEPIPRYSAGGMTWTYNYASRAKAFCRYDIWLKTSRSSSDIGRWTSLNPLSIAWELLPYSFVVDWFLDVGGYMRAMETSLLYRSQFVSGFQSSGYGADVSVTCHGDKKYYNGIQEFRGFTSAGYKRLFFERTVLSSYPAPYFPRINADLGSARLLSAAALLSKLL